jgi:hypothetical protein
MRLLVLHRNYYLLAKPNTFGLMLKSISVLYSFNSVSHEKEPPTIHPSLFMLSLSFFDKGPDKDSLGSNPSVGTWTVAKTSYPTCTNSQIADVSTSGNNHDKRHEPSRVAQATLGGILSWGRTNPHLTGSQQQPCLYHHAVALKISGQLHRWMAASSSSSTQ